MSEAKNESLDFHLREMFVPDPTHRLCLVILVARKPQFALLADNVEDLASNVSEIRVSGLTSLAVDVEFVNASNNEQDFGVTLDFDVTGRVSRQLLARCVVGHRHCRGEEVGVSGS